MLFFASDSCICNLGYRQISFGCFVELLVLEEIIK